MLNVFHNMQRLSYKPSGALEATSSNLRESKVKYFQQSISPEQCALHDQYFPHSNNNSCVETLIDISLILMYNVKKKVS